MKKFIIHFGNQRFLGSYAFLRRRITEVQTVDFTAAKVFTDLHEAETVKSRLRARFPNSTPVIYEAEFKLLIYK